MIRKAKAVDVHQVISLCTELHAKSSYSHIPIDNDKFKRLFVSMVFSNQSFIWVAEYDGEITAVLMGMVDEVFFSKKKYATDLLFHSKRGGGYLVRRFIKWAKEQKNVVDILVGVSSDVGDAKRVGALYEALGLKHSGGIYKTAVLQGE